MSKPKLYLSHAVLILASFFVGFLPLYYMICGATNPSIDVVRGKLIPGTYLIENFKNLNCESEPGARHDELFPQLDSAYASYIADLFHCRLWL